MITGCSLGTSLVRLAITKERMGEIYSPPVCGVGELGCGGQIAEVGHGGDVVADIIGFFGFDDRDLGHRLGANHLTHDVGVELRPGRFALLVVGVPGAQEAIDEAGHLLHQEFLRRIEGGKERKSCADLVAFGSGRRLDQGEFPFDHRVPVTLGLADVLEADFGHGAVGDQRDGGAYISEVQANA